MQSTRASRTDIKFSIQYVDNKNKDYYTTKLSLMLPCKKRCLIASRPLPQSSCNTRFKKKIDKFQGLFRILQNSNLRLVGL